jgi:penicillin-binding protein 1C
MKKWVSPVVALFLFLAIVYAVIPRPELKRFTTYSNAIFDNDGHLLRMTLAEDDRYRIYETLDNISPNLISASILYEDQNYYQHAGVDYLALLRAFWTTYIMHTRRVGASTIAMQVARLRWNIPSHTLGGKVEQILRATQLTRHYSKHEILEVYLNLAPYGRNIEGIAAASLIYFNKKPAQLSLPEALTLAVIPQNPNKRNPTTSKGMQHLAIARNNLLTRWLQNNPQDVSRKKYFELALNVRSPESLPFMAPHFINYINQQQSRWQKGYVDSSLNSHYQKQIEEIIKTTVAEKNNIGINNAAALLINYETMQIRAMVGSADFYNAKLQGQVNGALAKRSPGSTLKPFVYALAMDEGLIHPMTLMKDAQRRFAGFTPENYDKRFLGPIVAKDALIQSRNVPAVSLQSQLKNHAFYHFLTQAGVTNLKDESFYGLALVLGGAEVSMLELVNLYATLANRGKYQPASSLPGDKPGVAKQLLSAESAFLVLDILKDNPRPDALDFSVIDTMKNEVAWKTGTSWAFRDAWAVGVSGPYVLAVWVGNFNGKGNDAFIGRSAAGPLLFSVFDAIFPSRGWKVNDLLEAEALNLKKVKVCKTTGDLFSKHCPVSTLSWFIPGVSPINVSTIYRAIPVELASGLRACWHQPGKTQMKVFEFWSSEFLQLFQQAGISLKTPPKFSRDCNLDQKSSAGLKPVIQTPQNNLQYVIRSDNQASQQIPFSAVVDSDVETLYWFVDDKYAGSSTRDETFIWQAVSGKFVVRVVDDAGRAASVLMSVLQLQ